MGYIEFTKKMTTGNREVDTQHKRLVNAFNDFLGAFRLKKHQEELGVLLLSLVDYATYHFSTEESWMLNIGFPEAGCHANEHQGFVQRLSAIQKDFTDGRPVSLEILSFLSRWLRTHLQGSDMKVARFERLQRAVRVKAA